jgi:hypothetical protein
MITVTHNYGGREKTDNTWQTKKITLIIFARRQTEKNIKLVVLVPVQMDIAVFPTLPKDTGFGPRSQVVNETESGLGHGLLYQK